MQYKTPAGSGIGDARFAAAPPPQGEEVQDQLLRERSWDRHDSKQVWLVATWLQRAEEPLCRACLLAYMEKQILPLPCQQARACWRGMPRKHTAMLIVHCVPLLHCYQGSRNTC